MSITELRIFIGRQVGFAATYDGSSTATGNLSPADQTLLTSATIRYIAQNPGDFSESQVALANAELGRANNMTIQDTSFNWKMFFDELESNALAAGNKVGDIGRGVLDLASGAGKAVSGVGKGLGNLGAAVDNTTKTVSWILPVAIIIALGLLAYMFFKGGAKGIAAGI